ncbi:MAG: type II toxin-antitoxin system RelE/ParE family toxin [Patescibacteria group bacterium]
MDKIKKALQRLTKKEQKIIKKILHLLKSGTYVGLDIKKLKGREDIFRVRKNDFRIIYRVDHKGSIFILTIERRNEKTYKKF